MRYITKAVSKPNSRNFIIRGRILATLAGLVAFIALCTLLTWNNVPTALSKEDIVYIEKLFSDGGYDNPKQAFGDLKTLKTQIRAIRETQKIVLAAVQLSEPIPLGVSREPQDFYRLRIGQCHDTSRTMEKMLSYLGFEVRHVAIYSKINGRSVLQTLVTPQNPSHALSEVKTTAGWLLVDSLTQWLGIDSGGGIYAAEDVQKNLHVQVQWTTDNPALPNSILERDFTYVLGLYSRHGRFYAPYVPFPDVNFQQLVQNIGTTEPVDNGKRE